MNYVNSANVGHSYLSVTFIDCHTVIAYIQLEKLAGPTWTASRPIQHRQAVPRNIDHLHTTVGENHGTKEHRNQQCQANEQINLRHTLSPYE